MLETWLEKIESCAIWLEHVDLWEKHSLFSDLNRNLAIINSSLFFLVSAQGQNFHHVAWNLHLLAFFNQFISLDNKKLFIGILHVLFQLKCFCDDICDPFIFCLCLELTLVQFKELVVAFPYLILEINKLYLVLQLVAIAWVATLLH